MVKGWEEENKSKPENIILFKDRIGEVKDAYWKTEIKHEKMNDQLIQRRQEKQERKATMNQ